MQHPSQIIAPEYETLFASVLEPVEPVLAARCMNNPKAQPGQAAVDQQLIGA